MKKHQPRKLKLAKETLRELDSSDIRRAMGRQDYQCAPDDQGSTGGFSGMPISYCDNTGGCGTNDSCNSACP
jgi:hypothetical protein